MALHLGPEGGCPVRVNGLELRPACAHCLGRPRSGQLNVPKKSVLYLEEEPAEYAYALVEGFLKEARTLPDGRTQGIRVVRPGDLVGIEALLGMPYQSTVEAVTEVHACALSAHEIEKTLASEPDQGVSLIKAMARQTIELKSAMLRIGAMSAEERLLAILEDLVDGERGRWVKLPVTRQELADMLGLALGTVSRDMQRLKREGRFELEARSIRLPRAPG